MPATGELLDRVRAAGAELEVQGNHLKIRAPAPLPPAIVEALRASKAALLFTVKFAERIRRANDWQDLHAVLTDAQVAFVTGDVVGEDVERLASEADVRSHSLPEYSPTSKRKR
jgi:hypothetical protein